MTAPIPLVADLDGTLIARDSLWYLARESVRRFDLSFVPAFILGGRKRFKSCLARRHGGELDLDSLPWLEGGLRLIDAARAEGRPVWLVTAANEIFAERIAERIGVDGHAGSNDRVNLRGRAKASWLVEEFGMRGFDYMGDSKVDLPVWACARVAYVESRFKDIARVMAVCDDVRRF